MEERNLPAKKNSGVYKITSPTGKIYIGKSTNIKNRWKTYYSLSCISQPLLYASLMKHKPETHIFEVQEEFSGSDKELSALELKWYLHYKNSGHIMLNAKMPDESINYNSFNDELDEWYDRQQIWFYIMKTVKKAFNRKNKKSFINLITILVNNNIVKIHNFDNLLVISNNYYAFTLQLK